MQYYIHSFFVLKNKEGNISSIVGIVVSAICLVFLKEKVFIIPSMIIILIFLSIMRKKLENTRHIEEELV